MKKLFSLRYAYHEMVRTKCLNIYLVFFGFYFQLGLHREYAGNLKGRYLGLSVAPNFPWKPWRARFFIPSIYTITDVLNYYIGLNGGYCLSKKIYFSYRRFQYSAKN